MSLTGNLTYVYKKKIECIYVNFDVLQEEDEWRKMMLMVKSKVIQKEIDKTWVEVVPKWTVHETK